MDLETWALFAVVIVLGLNQAVMRTPTLREHPVPFWILQILDILAGTAVLSFGLPGFDGVPAVSWVLGLLFFLHSSQNLRMRQEELRFERQAAIAEERATRARDREDEDEDPPTDPGAT